MLYSCGACRLVTSVRTRGPAGIAAFFLGATGARAMTRIDRREQDCNAAGAENAPVDAVNYLIDTVNYCRREFDRRAHRPGQVLQSTVYAPHRRPAGRLPGQPV